MREASRSWFFIGTVRGKRFELGFGSALDISLASAREKAAQPRLHALEGRDPRRERDSGKARQKARATFGVFAREFIAGIESGFENPASKLLLADTLLVASQRRLLQRADQVVLLVVSSKFAVSSGAIVCELDEIDFVVTDHAVQPDTVTLLRAKGIEVIIAEAI